MFTQSFIAKSVKKSEAKEKLEILPPSFHSKYPKIKQQIDITYQASFFAQAMKYENEEGKSEISLVAYKVDDKDCVEIMIVTTNLTFVSTNGALKPDQVEKISTNQLVLAIESLFQSIKPSSSEF